MTHLIGYKESEDEIEGLLSLRSNYTGILFLDNV